MIPLEGVQGFRGRRGVFGHGWLPKAKHHNGKGALWQGKHHGRAAVMEGRAENHTPGKAALRRIQPQRGEQDPVATGLPQPLIQTIRAIPAQQAIEFGHGRLGSNS